MADRGQVEKYTNDFKDNAVRSAQFEMAMAIVGLIEKADAQQAPAYKEALKAALKTADRSVRAAVEDLSNPKRIALPDDVAVQVAYYKMAAQAPILAFSKDGRKKSDRGITS